MSRNGSSTVHAVGRDVTHHSDCQKIANDLKQSKNLGIIDSTTIGDRLHSIAFYLSKIGLGTWMFSFHLCFEEA